MSAVPEHAVTRLLTVPASAHLADAEQPAIITPVVIEHLEQQ